MARITCKRPPWGWKCKRPYPHTGPCAAVPTWWNAVLYKTTGKTL